jgi:tetraacyldisaccharide 4'-kinase
VYHGEAEADGFGMKLVGDRAINNLNPSLNVPLSQLAGSICHGVAGIGNPGRFFDHLVSQGLGAKVHRFPDHHRFVETDLCFNDEAPVLMTEKDAVKCFRFARDHHWHVPVEAQLDCGFGTQLLKILKGRLHE